jgi:hypothetical protein
MTVVQWDPAFAQPPVAVNEAAPVEPVTAVLNAFHTHRLVALAEGDHNNLQGYAFRMALIHNAQFPGLVNDIVVESGNSLYQEVMDKFVAGEDVPYDSLRRVWQDTTQPGDVWDKPIYEEFYRAVRALNSGLPRERRLRVLLGDPPIDWATIHSISDLTAGSPSSRDSVPVEIIRREVLAKSRRALIVYGGMHLQRHDYAHNYEPGDYGIVEVLERNAPGSVFSIWTNTSIDLKAVHPRVSSWPNPSLAILKGTSLGGQDFAAYYPFPIYLKDKDGKINPQRPTRPLRMEDQFDAILYVGPKSSITYSSLSPELCRDEAYLKMRAARRELFAGLAPASTQRADPLKKKCEEILAHVWQ